jgi:glucokinase
MTAPGPSDTLSLVADIGGTNTRVALARGAAGRCLQRRRYRNAEHDGLASVIAAYLDLTGITDAEIGGVCVAGAGPVRDGVVQLTNLDWRIDRTRWGQRADRRKILRPERPAGAGPCDRHIAPENLIEVLPQPPHSPTPRNWWWASAPASTPAPSSTPRRAASCRPSEAGHVACPSPSRASDAIIDRIGDSHGFPSVEEVLSGRGVSTLHAALHGIDVQPADILAGMESERDDAAALATGGSSFR